jgi:hypothetical protein
MTTYDITGISFVDANNGYAAATNFNGSDAYILHTIDGGGNWTKQFHPSTYLNEITMVNQNLGYVVGWDGKIYNTTDGGVNWNLQNSGVASTLYTVSFTNENSGWAAGVGGVILHTDNGGFPVGIGDQNNTGTPAMKCSPNPACEATTLTFTNAHPGRTQITIYNAVGDLISTVSDEHREAGAFSLKVNTSGYVTGIYFVKLNNGVTTQMTKLIIN